MTASVPNIRQIEASMNRVLAEIEQLQPTMSEKELKNYVLSALTDPHFADVTEPIAKLFLKLQFCRFPEEIRVRVMEEAIEEFRITAPTHHLTMRAIADAKVKGLRARFINILGKPHFVMDLFNIVTFLRDQQKWNDENHHLLQTCMQEFLKHYPAHPNAKAVENLQGKPFLIPKAIPVISKEPAQVSPADDSSVDEMLKELSSESLSKEI